MLAHWQNLNEDSRGRIKGLPWHGRAWVSGDRRGALRWEWVLGRPAVVQLVAIALGVALALRLGGGLGWLALLLPAVTAVQLSVDAGEQDVGTRVVLPLMTLYVHLEGVLPRWLGQRLAAGAAKREVGLSFHDAAIWWNLGMDPDEWNSTDPRWRRGCWHPLDTLLGKVGNAEVEVLDQRDVVVPMPERAYPAKATLRLTTWTRPRWFQRRRYSCEIDLGANPIPVPGKGENSWDCDDDAIYSQHTGASTIEQGIADLVGSVLRTRRQRGGTHRPPTDKQAPPAWLQLLDEAARVMRGPGDTWALPPAQQALADRWWAAVADERRRYSNPVAYADAVLAQLVDGHAMALSGTYGQLLRVLSRHCGEQSLLARGTSEGAVDTLQRIIRERNGVAAEVISGALMDFLGWLTTRDQALTLGAAHDAPPAIEALQAWARLRGFPIFAAEVADWQRRVARDKATPTT